MVTDGQKMYARTRDSSNNLYHPILQGLRDYGFARPSPIQLNAIPVGRFGCDLIAQAKSDFQTAVRAATNPLDSAQTISR